MERESPGRLACLCAGVAVLLSSVWLLFHRTSGAGRSPPEGRAAPTGAALVLPPDTAAQGLAAVRVSWERESGDEGAHESSTGAPAVEDAPARIEGRVTLDGRPPPCGGRVLLLSHDGSREGSALVDHEGRFRLDDVRAGGLVLSFDLQSPNQRVLLLPKRRVEVPPGRTTELNLDWKTKHVNLKVIGDGAGWNKAKVHVAGPDHDASIETDDDGEAGLSLVGAGLFTFQAVQPSGRQGEASLELEEGTDLDSILIQTAGQPSR